MKVPKAIELLSDYCDRHCVTLDEDFRQAVKMGKEALILCQNIQNYAIFAMELYEERKKGEHGHEPDPRD